MKTTILFCTFIGLISINLSAQSFESSYVRSTNSSFCGEETHRFNFLDSNFRRTDTYDGSVTKGPSQKVESNYDDNGYYYEIRTPEFVLEEQGIDAYRSFNHYSHKIVFDKRGGNVLYVYEVEGNNTSNGKFFFTDAGYQIFCN